MLVVGFAAPFNVTSARLWPDGRRGPMVIARGAFRSALAVRDVRLRINHNRQLDVARLSDGTFSVWESPSGLMFSLHTQHAVGACVLGHVLRGGYSGVSVGFLEATSLVHEVQDALVFIEMDVVEISLVSRHVAPQFRETWVRAMTLSDLQRWDEREWRRAIDAL
jgi:HK97 family phage prohead protease